MTHPSQHPKQCEPTEPPLPADALAALENLGLREIAHDEVALRRLLEQHTSGYTLYRLTPAAARRWKCRYRIMLADTYYDSQSVAEAYARALVACLQTKAD